MPLGETESVLSGAIEQEKSGGDCYNMGVQVTTPSSPYAYSNTKLTIRCAVL